MRTYSDLQNEIFHIIVFFFLTLSARSKRISSWPFDEKVLIQSLHKVTPSSLICVNVEHVSMCEFILLIPSIIKL